MVGSGGKGEEGKWQGIHFLKYIPTLFHSFTYSSTSSFLSSIYSSTLLSFINSPNSPSIHPSIHLSNSLSLKREIESFHCHTHTHTHTIMTFFLPSWLHQSIELLKILSAGGMGWGGCKNGGGVLFWLASVRVFLPLLSFLPLTRSLFHVSLKTIPLPYPMFSPPPFLSLFCFSFTLQPSAYSIPFRHIA